MPWRSLSRSKSDRVPAAARRKPSTRRAAAFRRDAGRVVSATTCLWTFAWSRHSDDRSNPKPAGRPTEEPRPDRPLGRRPQSGGHAPVTCRSAFSWQRTTAFLCGERDLPTPSCRMSLWGSSGRCMSGAAARGHNSRTRPLPELLPSLLNLSSCNPADTCRLRLSASANCKSSILRPDHSSATSAFNAGEWFRRGFLLMLRSPCRHDSWALSRKQHSLLALFRFPGPPQISTRKDI